MRLAVWPDAGLCWRDLAEVAAHADATGWDGFYLADHLMAIPGGRPAPAECWTTLAALAATTRRLRLGSLVTCVSYRHPAVVATMAATIERIAASQAAGGQPAGGGQAGGCRVVVGLGSGWNAAAHQAYGFGFEAASTRNARLAEACGVVRALFDGTPVAFDGSFYTLHGASPARSSSPAALPLLVGGAGALTRAVVARHADEWNTWGLPRHCEIAARQLEDDCIAAARPPSAISHSAQALFVRPQDVAAAAAWDPRIPTIAAATSDQLAEAISAYGEVGVDELVVPTFLIPGANEQMDFLDWFRRAAHEAGVVVSAGPGSCVDGGVGGRLTPVPR